MYNYMSWIVDTAQVHGMVSSVHMQISPPQPFISHSYYLYSIAHPDKKGCPLIDLSKDKEATIDASGLSPFQTAVERVIQKVFTHYAIPLSISDPIRMTFRSKLWRMGKCLSTIGGGIQREQKLKEWKEGPNSVWSLQVSSKEVCRQLSKHKLLVEKQLDKEVSKRRKLESNVRILQTRVQTLQKVNDRNARALGKLRSGLRENTRGESKKPWNSYSRKHRGIKKNVLHLTSKYLFHRAVSISFQYLLKYKTKIPVKGNILILLVVTTLRAVQHLEILTVLIGPNSPCL